MATVIVPAHNEAAVIGRLLDGLTSTAQPGEFEVIVVSNGSTDDTAAVAARYPYVRVVELAEPSKALALREGEALARDFPLLYVDADVEFDTASARQLLAALDEVGVFAAAPRRVLVLDGASWPVRAYHRVWEQLPAVRDGLYGRGVIAVTAAGAARIADRPPDVLGDDLYVHNCFQPGERRVVAASQAIVRGPKTVKDLLNRRVRAAQGNAQLSARTGGVSGTSGSSGRELVVLARRGPSWWPGIAVFVAITLTARLRARRMRRAGTGSTWLRDESTRG